MPIVHTVKKARKAIRGTGIKKGDTYYWWRFYRQVGRTVSLTYPKPSQLTRSPFLSQYYSLQEQIEAIATEISSDELEDIASQLEQIADELEQLGQEQSDNRSNMPEQLQDGDTGQLLEERADSCENTVQEIRDAARAIRDLEPEEQSDADEEELIDISDELNSINWEL